MVNEEILQVCQDELIKLSSGLESTGNIELLGLISKKIGGYFKLRQFSLKSSIRNKQEYIVYSFRDTYDNMCIAAFKFNPDNIIDTFTSHISSIILGEKALQILNDITDDYKTKSGVDVDVQYQWGRSNYCTIGSWDFDHTTVKLSDKALTKLISMFNEGENSFKLKMGSLVEESELGKRNIVEFIKRFDEIGIHTVLGAKLQPASIEKLLTRYMISKSDAIKICHKNKDMNGIQNILVVYVINQLGSFAVLSNWKVDYNSKSVDISIVDDQIIDLESATIVSNFGICSRIEQILKLNDLDINSIFAN